MTQLELVVLLLINTSLSSGCVSRALKHAVVKPLIKMKNLDPSIFSSFRSQLTFLSKVLEKEVYIQLQSYLTQYNIHEKFHSGFRPRNKMETALLGARCQAFAATAPSLWNSLRLHIRTSQTLETFKSSFKNPLLLNGIS